MFRALYDFDGMINEDLSFKKGDMLEILDRELVYSQSINPDKLYLLFCCIHSDSSDWMYARHASSTLQGYVPRNYVVDSENTLAQQVFVFLWIGINY